MVNQHARLVAFRIKDEWAYNVSRIGPLYSPYLDRILFRFLVVRRNESADAIASPLMDLKQKFW